MIHELTSFEIFQLERYGNILGTAEVMPEYEAGEEERQRLQDWFELQAELSFERQENEYWD